MNVGATGGDRLRDLAGAVFNSTAAEDDFVELDALLRKDEVARRRYASYCQLHVALRLKKCGAERGTQEIVSALR